MARAEYFSPENQAEHYRVAEAGYRRAIELYERYSKALYGLGVLYVYELDRPAEAISFLERYLNIHNNDIGGMFVLAAARYMIEDYAGAVELYDQILSSTKDREVIINAERNKQQVMDEWYR
jgi:tetratricopeptide (TPR) repeat protein